MQNILQIATLEQELEILKSNYSSWGSPLSLEKYITRESTLKSRPYANGRTCWILTNESNSRILSSCESYESTCFINGLAGTVWAIASVYTSIDYRKKGYATEMMKLLLIECKKQGCIASILYSDIGPLFYAKLGWKLYPSKQVSFDTTDKVRQCDLVSLIRLEEVSELISMQDRVTDKFIVPVTFEKIDWLFTRSKFYAKEKNLEIEYCGARYMQEYILWMHDFKEDKMMILYSKFDTREGAMKLIEAGIIESQRCELKTVCIWEPEYPDLKGGVLEEREDSLSSLAILVEVDQEVEWSRNEKYSWV